MDVTLHLGAHRTATTSFQGYLAQNKRVLREQGLTTFGPGETRTGLLTGLLKRPDRATSRDDRLARRSVGRLQVEQELLEAAGQRRLLISEENLIGSMADNIARTSLYPDVGARLTRLRDGVTGHLSRIGLTIRRYDTYWASVAAIRVLKGGCLPSEGVLDRLVTQPRRWRHVIEEISQVFPGVPLHVVPFERFAGRPAAYLSKLAPEIVSPPAEHSGIWHHKGRSSRQIRDVLALRGDGSAISLGNPGQRWHPFNDLQAEALVAEYEDDLRWLRSGADGLALFEEGRDDMTKAVVRKKKSRARPLRERPMTHGRQAALV